MSPEDIQRLVRELHVYQIELRMQNEELRRAQAELGQSHERFNDLYDHAPVGYLTLDTRGIILKANLKAAQMLGVARQELLERNLSRFLSGESQNTFSLHQQVVVSSGQSQTGELVLRRPDGSALPVQFESNVFANPASKAVQCRTVLIDITKRKQAEEELQHASRQLQALSQRLVESQEVERRHIARELHDQIGQSLTAIQINLQTALALPDPAGIRTRLGESLQFVDELVQQTQDLSLSLRPSLLDDLGLEAALRWLTEVHASRARLRAEFRADPLERRLDAVVETACFRVAQEALTNVTRHARAQSVAVHLQREDSVLALTVRDDGRGFDVGAGRGTAGGSAGLGLLGMGERVALVGGNLEVQSGTGDGTRVHARFPLKWRLPDTGGTSWKVR